MPIEIRKAGEEFPSHIVKLEIELEIDDISEAEVLLAILNSRWYIENEDWEELDEYRDFLDRNEIDAEKRTIYHYIDALEVYEEVEEDNFEPEPKFHIGEKVRVNKLGKARLSTSLGKRNGRILAIHKAETPPHGCKSTFYYETEGDAGHYGTWEDFLELDE
jgi:hypothetical protein